MTKAIYALSADPITNGHIDVILKASKMFDELIVAIGNNPSKKYTLDKQTRYNITQNVFRQNKNISVLKFEGALVDFSDEVDANIIVRGLRNINDFQYEQELAAINKSLKPSIETCFILSEPNKSHISSSSSKSIVKEGFDASDYLPIESKKELEKKINGQILIGITGLMGTGKSYIAEKLAEKSYIHNIDLDLLCHQIYDKENLKHEKTRELLIKEFGTLDKREIGKIVFNDDIKMEKLNNIFRKPLKYLVRKSIIGLKGIILINGATLIAENYLNLVNNNIIFVHANDNVRYQRCLKGRNIPKEVLIERDKKMIPSNKQMQIITDKIKNDGTGEVIIFDNSTDELCIVDLISKLRTLIDE